MTTFLDGPAGGQVLQLRRAPLYLRIVRGTSGEFDALDQLDDTPADGEQIAVYRRVGEAGAVHIDYRDKQGRRRGAWFSTAEYRVVVEQSADEVARDTASWRRWCTAQQEKEQNG